MDEDIQGMIDDSKNQNRYETEPSATDDEKSVSLDEAVTDAYERIDDGDLPENLTMRDRNLAALFDGLDATNELSSVGKKAATHLDVDTDDDLDARGNVLNLLVRVGLDEVDPQAIVAAKEGKREFLASQADEF